MTLVDLRRNHCLGIGRELRLVRWAYRVILPVIIRSAFLRAVVNIAILIGKRRRRWLELDDWCLEFLFKRYQALIYFWVIWHLLIIIWCIILTLVGIYLIFFLAVWHVLRYLVFFNGGMMYYLCLINELVKPFLVQYGRRRVRRYRWGRRANNPYKASSIYLLLLVTEWFISLVQILLQTQISRHEIYSLRMRIMPRYLVLVGIR